MSQSYQLPSLQDIDWFRTHLLNWFKFNGRDFLWRKKSAGSYIKIVSEVLLQRTKAETVAAFLPDFIKCFPSWAKLAMASEEELQVFLKPIGLWRRRSASLKRLAAEMARRRGKFPTTREEIEMLSGVGQYIANAILLFHHGDPQPLLDVNMARVLERFFGSRKLVDIRYDQYLQNLAKMVVTGRESILVNWALLDHAALICKQGTPRCNICPVVMKCKYANANST